ncbi:MAG: gamma-glutamyltransferase [Desulfobulbaceae bacterium]|nr:gamma-glutamyltransferase [Desulfobulbaceae bacterium]
MTFMNICASGHPLVSEAAIEILDQGGNAFDAVLAAGFVSSVAEPALTSLGGGGFLMSRTSNNEIFLFDFFTDTPGKGLGKVEPDPHFFPVTVEFSGSNQDFNVGMGSVAVPGTLKGYLHVHKKLGSLPLSRILQPAVKAARSGVHLSEQQAHFLELLEPILTMTEEGKKLYLQDGCYPGTGHLLKNNDLAAFFEHLADDHDATFYSGKWAEQINKDMANGKGILTRDDLSQYQVIERDPISVNYKGFTLLTNPPPSFGGSLIAMALEELATYSHLPCSPSSPEYVFAHGKIMLSVDEMRHKVHNNNVASQKQKTFSRGTTHISVVDKAGNVASLTNSNGEGSGYIVPGTGIMLNNMMGEDDLHPGGFHTDPPGMRVASMMSPSILLDTNEEVKLVIGSGGSKRIRTTLTQVISLIVDCGLDVQEAINFPRLHWDGESFQVEPGFSTEALRELGKLGPVNVWSEKNVYFGGVHAVMPGQGGGGDPRRGGAVRISG